MKREHKGCIAALARMRPIATDGIAFLFLSVCLSAGHIHQPCETTEPIEIALSKHARTPGRRRDSITGRDAGTAAVRAFLFQRGWCLAFYLCLYFIYNCKQ